VGAPTPWHQDEPNYDDDDIVSSATVSVALDEATVEGGCLQYIPVSFNRSENLPHVSRQQEAPAGFTGTDTFSWVAPDALDESLAVPGTVPAGGATMHYMRTLHHAGWNRSPIPRRSIAIRYSLHREG
jgi:ectoine hydroxylase-related dioxygenase (phytanoyl-CoA dioxygenase family)